MNQLTTYAKAHIRLIRIFWRMKEVRKRKELNQFQARYWDRAEDEGLKALQSIEKDQDRFDREMEKQP